MSNTTPLLPQLPSEISREIILSAGKICCRDHAIHSHHDRVARASNIPIGRREALRAVKLRKKFCVFFLFGSTAVVVSARSRNKFERSTSSSVSVSMIESSSGALAISTLHQEHKRKTKDILGLFTCANSSDIARVMKIAPHCIPDTALTTVLYDVSLTFNCYLRRLSLLMSPIEAHISTDALIRSTLEFFKQDKDIHMILREYLIESIKTSRETDRESAYWFVTASLKRKEKPYMGENGLTRVVRRCF